MMPPAPADARARRAQPVSTKRSGGRGRMLRPAGARTSTMSSSESRQPPPPRRHRRRQPPPASRNSPLGLPVAASTVSSPATVSRASMRARRAAALCPSPSPPISRPYASAAAPVSGVAWPRCVSKSASALASTHPRNYSATPIHTHHPHYTQPQSKFASAPGIGRGIRLITMGVGAGPLRSSQTRRTHAQSTRRQPPPTRSPGPSWWR
eukprot:COSAG01_NODE_10881_length_2060_cov_320.175331_2_plen_209_part_00